MIKAKIYNQEGKEIGEEKLNPKVFEIEIKEGLIQEVVVAQRANQRQVLAHTKGRSEIRGGGKKPWRQKGTGRARHGSSRSPIWVGGGVTFGPTKERNFSRRVNKKVRKKALLMCLSDKAKNQKLILLDKLELSEPKTKLLADILLKLPLSSKKSIVALAKSDKKLIRASQNLKKTWVTQAASLNVYDLLDREYLVMTKDSLPILEKTFL